MKPTQPNKPTKRRVASPRTKQPTRRASRTPKELPKKTLPTSRRQQLTKAAFITLGLGFLAFMGTFLYVDSQVRERVGVLHSSTVPVILSSPLELSGMVARLRDGIGVKKGEAWIERLRAILVERRYGEVEKAMHPGEFSLTPRELTIVTREYRDHAGRTVPSQRSTIPLSGPIPEKPLLLEPQVVSYLGSDEMRASRFTPLARIPKHVQQAVLDTEDERFYHHLGVDPIGIARAMVRNLMALRLVQGGSTITQQLAKNIFLSPKKTLKRKLMEVPTALSIERHLTKDQILELYLNEVYLGQEGAVAIHGFPSAATAFFGKRIEDLTIDEAALLAGMIRAPSSYNPRKHEKDAQERRDVVLAKMHEKGDLTANQLASAKAAPLQIARRQEFQRAAPFFTAAIQKELETAVDPESAGSSGLAVYSGIDIGMQSCAEQSVARAIARIEKGHPRIAQHPGGLQAAVVAIEPYSGLVKAWVGGRDFSESQFNRVSQSTRQIGSTIKPFLYLTALDGSLNSYKIASPISVLQDTPQEIAGRGAPAWSPENYDRDFRGDVSLRYALENSLNMPAIYIAKRVGLKDLTRTFSAFQLAQNIKELPSLALGALDTNLLRLTAAYGALANAGVYTEPRLFLSALDDQGGVLAAHPHAETKVADENAVYVLTNILQGVLTRGTGKGARAAGFQRDAAGKTGTSDSARDAWFVGFTPNLVVGVWLGFDDNSPLGLTGGAVAAPLWGDFMACSEPYLPTASFIPPEGVTFVEIDSASRELATPECPPDARVQEVFVRGTEPTDRCTTHGGEPAQREDEHPGPQQGEVHREPDSLWDRLFR